MNPNTFQEQNEGRWQELERLLDRLEGNMATEEEASRLPELFRQVCSDLSLAQNRMYGLALCERINRLVIRGYNYIHRSSGNLWRQLAEGIAYTLPRLVRQEWRLFWLCNLLFWGPFVAMMASGYADMRWIQSLMGPQEMAQVESFFGHGAKISEMRDHFGSNFRMFAFYIHNNVGIDFQTFAGGILVGLGTIFFLIFNGIAIGATAGYVMQACDPINFLNWVSGHSAFELTGMILSGMAGLRLGMAILHPGRLTRRQALVSSGKKAFILLAGAAGMTSIAAVIEGFWSPLEIDPMYKYAFGLVMAYLVFAYLAFAGGGKRRRET